MIQRTVYFRDEADIKKWNKIQNKAAWLHEKLNENEVEISAEVGLKQSLRKTGAMTGIKTVNPGMKFCPNGHPIPVGRTKCMGKGCQYS